MSVAGNVKGTAVGIGDFIRERRSRLGMTQRDVARASDIDQSKLSRIERDQGSAFPSPEELQRLAGALGVSVTDMLYVAGYLGADTDVAQTESDDALVYTMYDTVARMELPEYVKEHIRQTVEYARRLRDGN